MYSINRPGRLLNFWTLRVSAYSRWALIRIITVTVVSLANLHKRPEALARYYVTSYWQAEWVKRLRWKTIELPPPVPDSMIRAQRVMVLKK